MRRPLTRLVLILGLLTACTPLRQVSTPAPANRSTVAPTAPGSEPAPPTAPERPRTERPSDAELLALPDAIPRVEPRALLGNPAFYEVYGQRYKVLASSRGHIERGVASWYGPDFHGIATSTGEPYDMYSMTAAHKTLPLPAYVRVTNLRNSRSIVVRVNDRGPFKSNRIIDLSYAAALKLDMIREGTTLVEIQAVEPDGSYAQDAAPVTAALFAQVGAFGVLDNARRLQERLTNAGFESVKVQSTTTTTSTLHRVRIGPIQSVEAYDALVERLHQIGLGKVVLAPN